MNGNATRNKGRRGQREAKLLLAERDWRFVEVNAGEADADILAIDQKGRTWCVEVKNTAAITTAHRAQAMKQAQAKRLPWMLMSKVAGTPCWLVQRQGVAPAIWTERLIALEVKVEVS